MRTFLLAALPCALLLACGGDVAFPLDGGVDASTTDAGATDAGANAGSDAGVDGGAGGGAIGTCGCAAGPAEFGAWLALAFALLARRAVSLSPQRRGRVGVRGHAQ